MNQVMTPRRFLSLLVPASGNPAGRRPVILMLGLAGIILGILGMHVLGASHQAPDTAGLSAASAHQAVSHDHGPAVMATDGTVGGEADSTCYGPCNGEHHLMAAMCVLIVIVLAVLWFLPKRWFIIPGKGCAPRQSCLHRQTGCRGLPHSSNSLSVAHKNAGRFPHTGESSGYSCSPLCAVLAGY